MAVNECIEAASYEFNAEAPKSLYRAAYFGKEFLSAYDVTGMFGFQEFCGYLQSLCSLRRLAKRDWLFCSSTSNPNVPLADFQMTIRAFPLAQNLYKKYCQLHSLFVLKGYTRRLPKLRTNKRICRGYLKC